MSTQNWLAISSLILNVVWFLYAMLNTRFVRRHVRRVEDQLLTCEPAVHAWELEQHFRKKRNAQGIMLMASVTSQLQIPPPKRKAKTSHVTYHDSQGADQVPPKP